MSLRNLLLCASVTMIALSTAASDGFVSHRVSGTPSGKSSASWKFNKTLGRAGIITPSRADDTRYPVTLDLKTSAGEDIDYIVALRDEGGKMKPYYSHSDEDLNPIMELPEGTFQVLGFGYAESLDATLIVYLDKFTFAQGGTLTLDAATATNRTDIDRVGPGGETLTLPDWDGIGGNCNMGNALDIISYNGEVLFMGDLTQFAECGRVVRSTPGIPPAFSLVRYQIMASPAIGMMSMTIPVDFSKSRAGSTAQGWQSAELNFARTPFNLKADDLEKQLSEQYGEEYVEYSFSQILLTLADNSWFGTLGMGVEGDGAITASGKAHLWMPAGFSAPVVTSLIPLGSVFNGDKSSIKGMPLRLGSDGLVQCGVNLAFDNNMEGDATNIFYGSGNPLYTDIPGSDVLLGNCAPSMASVPDWSGKFLYSFTGRYGEDMGIDSFDAAEDVDPEVLEMLGGNTSSVFVTADGETVCDNLTDFKYGSGWDKNTVYTATVKTDNILIDGKIAGQVKGVLSYNPVENTSLPTVTALRFNDKDGKTTDRFEKGADGTLGLYAAALTRQFNESKFYTYYDYTPVTGVKVEYAPYRWYHEYDNWKELTVSPDTSKDFTPGWGNYYEGSLAGVNEGAAYGWFAVRVTLETADGASQQQVISPAFCIPSLATIESIATDSGDTGAVAEFYTLDGVRVNSDNLQPGLYIRHQGHKIEKVIVK